MTNPRATAAEKILEQREDLEDLADSDLRCSKYARELLAIADEHGGGG